MYAKLPIIDHLSSKDFKTVYEPCEDTFLFIDALLAEKDILAAEKPKLVLEIGPGSGVITTYFAMQQQQNQCPSFHIAVDINVEAARATMNTAKRNGVGAYVDVILGDLCTVFRNNTNCSENNNSEINSTHFKGKIFDVVMFNPPYVPSEPEEVGTFSIDAAWAGGENGRVVTDEFLRQAVLKDNNGILYLLLEKRNLPDQLCEEMKNGVYSNVQWQQLCVVKSVRARNEHLFIYKFTKV